MQVHNCSVWSPIGTERVRKRSYTAGFGGVVVLCILLICAANSHGQTPLPSPDVAAKVPTTSDKIKRWFEFDQLTAAFRYHFIENENKRKAANNFQYQFIAKMRFKFDPQGRYSLRATVGTGPSFISEWDSSGWGTGRTQRNINLRYLYLDAKPIKPVEVEVGGIGVNYGEHTEAVTYDSDHYITGERVRLFLPGKVWFDEVSVTYARLADLTTPNVFKRFKHFGNQNYHQFLIRKQLYKWIGFSADYTFESGVDTLHQAVRFRLPKGKLINTFLFEQYERVAPDDSYGYNAFAERAITKRFTLSGGFADIHILPPLNGDRFPPGKRIYFNWVAKLNREFSLTTQFTQGVGFIAPNIARTRLDVILTYNILESLKRTRLF